MTFGGSMLAVHVNKGARNPPKPRSCAASDVGSQRNAFDVWEEEKRAAEAGKAEQLREFRRQMCDAKAMQVRAPMRCLLSMHHLLSLSEQVSGVWQEHRKFIREAEKKHLESGWQDVKTREKPVFHSASRRRPESGKPCTDVMNVVPRQV